jgi:deoxyribose-phosphate aldolase
MSTHADARLALAALDLTELGDECSEARVEALVGRALTPEGAVAAVCIWPQFVALARERLAGTPVRIATVINFPAGGMDVERAVTDTREAVEDGAQEIDLVVPWQALRSGDDAPLREMVAAVAGEIPKGVKLKAILETGMLAEPALIRHAAESAIAAGAHFLKTSTGKTPVSATPEAAGILLETIRASGRTIGFKAAGGIRTLADAQIYLRLGAEIMGPDFLSPTTFRIGASALLEALLATLSAPEAA